MHAAATQQFVSSGLDLIRNCNRIEELVPSPERPIQVCAIELEEAQGNRQCGAKTVQGSDADAEGTQTLRREDIVIFYRGKGSDSPFSQQQRGTRQEFWKDMHADADTNRLAMAPTRRPAT